MVLIGADIKISTLSSKTNIIIDSPSVLMGENEFPATTAPVPRSTASFGSSSSTPSFIAKSQRQLVTTPTATIAPGITIVGVNYDGEVILTLADTQANLNEIDIVDEGGFCSPTKPISIGSSNGSANGRLKITVPFGNIEVKSDGSNNFFGKVKSDITTINPDGTSVVESEDGTVVNIDQNGESTQTNPDGSTTVVDPDGTETTQNIDGSETVVTPDGVSTTTATLPDGSTSELVINPDGSSVATVSDTTGGSTSFTTLADGTTIDAVMENNGNSTSYTVLPDGTTIDAVLSNTGASNTVTVLPDGTSVENDVQSNGNLTDTTIRPDGTVETDISRNNGTTIESVVNPDGSSYTFRVGSNTVVTETIVDSSGVETLNKYRPWQSFYRQTITPPGTTTSISPNPYQS